MIFLVNKKSTSPSISKFLSTFYLSRMVGGRANWNIKFLSKDFIKIKIISLVNRRSTSPSIPKVLSTFYFSSMVGGWIKISSFPKRFYQNINYIKFFQKLLSKVGTGIGPYGPSLCARFFNNVNFRIQKKVQIRP